jgi:predicted flavoprotein YhiN
VKRVAVVGAGAAGLTAALRAAESGAQVTLLNAHPRVGLKILMSGGSRCNVTHREVEARDYHGGSRHVVARILRAFSAAAAREWFESLGAPLLIEEDGRCFPDSNDAQTVLDALLGACERAGVTLECGARVVRIEGIGANARSADGAPDADAVGAARSADGAVVAGAGVCWRVGVRAVASGAEFPAAVPAIGAAAWPLPAAEPERWIEADAVVLATGGLSYPRTGCDGSGFALARALGHTIVAPVPALTPLTSDDPLCVFVQGLALEAELTLEVGGKAAEVARGSLLFTHFGVSGPAALDLSRSWLRAEGRGERTVRANFVPGLGREALLDEWTAVATAEPKLSVRRWLGRRSPDRLGVVLCAEVGVGPGKHASQVERARRAELVERVCARPLRVSGTLGYEKAEVTAGGVALDEVDASTLESRRAPGVFLCGEMLDVDGRLGGFNFQWAWSSGTVAGRAAGEKACGASPQGLGLAG